MAYLLEKAERHTIRGQLRAYMQNMRKIGIVLFLMFLLLFFYIILQHRWDTGYFLSLNTFYTELDDSHLELYHVMETSGENHEKKLETSFSLMEQALAKLTRLEVGSVLQRDIFDLQEMFYRYRACIKTVNERVLVEGLVEMAEIKPYYEEAWQLYDFLNKDFKNVYSQLLSFAAEQEQLQFMQSLVLLLALLLCFLGGLHRLSGKAEKIADGIVAPVQALVDQAQQVDAGSLEIIPDARLSNCAYQEIDTLAQVFEKMLLRIRKQMNEIVANADLKMQMRKKELDNLRISNELKSMELHALQMQINPHFLFNTLSMISRTAYLEGAEGTMELLECAASLLRYTLDSSMQAVTLEKELEMLGSYVYIQERRFGKRIQFRFHFDESFHQIKVPSLILQPLVENAIVHGLDQTVTDGEIIIETRRDEDGNTGCIIICDNGCGMDEPTLIRVQQHIKSGGIKNDRIGLGNIASRLCLFYGSEAELEITSMPEKGTAVGIRIPLVKILEGGNRDVSNFDCR